MDDRDEEIENLKKLHEELKEHLEAAAKVKKTSDQIIKILEHVDTHMALAIASVVAGRLIASAGKTPVIAKYMLATMHARIYEFLDMNFDNEEDEEEQTLQ